MSEKSYLNFGQALEALKTGKRISREGWSENKLFVFKQIEAEIDFSIVPNMKSLPVSVKDHFHRTFRNSDMLGISYMWQLCIVYSDNVITSWQPTGFDLLSEDWQILEDYEG